MVRPNCYKKHNCINETKDENMLTFFKNLKHDSLQTKKTSKISLLKKLAVLMTILIVFFIGYVIYCQIAFSSAEALYDDGDYYNAAQELNGVINLFGNNDMEKIRFSSTVGAEYGFYQSEINSESCDLKSAASHLFFGLKECLNAEKQYTDPYRMDIISDFEEKYYNELNWQFNLSKSEALKIVNMDMEGMNAKVKSIANKVSKEKLNVN